MMSTPPWPPGRATKFPTDSDVVFKKSKFDDLYTAVLPDFKNFSRSRMFLIA